MRVRIAGKQGERKELEVVSAHLNTETGELRLMCSDSKIAVLEIRNVEVVVEESFMPPMASYEIQRMMDGSPLVTVN